MAGDFHTGSIPKIDVVKVRALRKESILPGKERSNALEYAHATVETEEGFLRRERGATLRASGGRLPQAL